MRTRMGGGRTEPGSHFLEKIYLLCPRRYTYFADEVYLLLKVSSIALLFRVENSMLFRHVSIYSVCLLQSSLLFQVMKEKSVLNDQFCYPYIKNFAKTIGNTENFCNFVLGNHCKILWLHSLWLLQCPQETSQFPNFQ